MWLLRGLLTICLFDLWWGCSAEVSPGRLQEAVNSFSVDFLKAVYEEEPGNLVASPVSVSILLALLNQGARHNSSSQLESVLHLTQQESREGYGQLSRRLQQPPSTAAILEAANHLFVSHEYQLRTEFRDIAEQEFRSGVEPVTFGSGEGATAINDWVSRATHGRIPSIVGPSLDADTALVLVNAIFFKSPWQTRFSKHLTTNQTFSVSPGKEVTVPMMHHYHELFRAGIDEERDLKWVQLPFEDENFLMIVIVPNEKFGLARILRNFTEETLGELLQAGSTRDVTLDMPSFKISSEIALRAPLEELGAKDIFDPSTSDLSGIVTSSNPLYVSKALQKADIKVDEEGAAAAAATVMQLVPVMAREPVNPMEISANHPFLAILMDTGEKLPLFMNIISDPSST